MPLTQSPSREAFVSNLKAELGAGKPRDQALAIAFSVQRRNKHASGGKAGFPHPHLGGIRSGGIGHQVMSMGEAMPSWTRSEASGIGRTHRQHFAAGGISMGMAEPPWTRSEARQINDMPFHSGLIHSAVPGRTDRLPLAVGAESHVIPSDSVSSLGQGNTAAGARIWQAAIKNGPWGVQPPRAVHGHGPPSAPHIAQSQTGLATGGRGKTAILAAGGEIVVPAEDVEALGQRGIAAGMGKRGETAMDCGHRLIDEAIARIRKYTIEWLRHAPAPKK